MVQPATTPRSSGLARAPERRDTARLKNMLFETDTSLTLAPLQVIFFALGFILCILFLHIATKVVPSTTPLQILVSIAIVAASLGVSVLLKRK